MSGDAPLPPVCPRPGCGAPVLDILPYTDGTVRAVHAYAKDPGLGLLIPDGCYFGPRDPAAGLLWECQQAVWAARGEVRMGPQGPTLAPRRRGRLLGAVAALARVWRRAHPRRERVRG